MVLNFFARFNAKKIQRLRTAIKFEGDMVQMNWDIDSVLISELYCRRRGRLDVNI